MDFEFFISLSMGNATFTRNGLMNFNNLLANLKECGHCEEYDTYPSNIIEYYLREKGEPDNEKFDNEEFAEYFLEKCSVTDKDFYVCCDKCDGWEPVDQETHDNFQNNNTHFNCIKCTIKVPPTISPTNITSKKKQ